MAELISFRIEKELAERLRKEAITNDETVSQIIRRLIRKHLENKGE